MLVAITDGGNEPPPELTDRAAAVTSCLPCIYRIHLPARLLRPAAIGWPVAEPNPGSASGHPPEGPAEIGQLPVASPGPGLVRKSAQPNGREIRFADDQQADSLTERYVDLVRSAMGVPG